MSFGNPFFSVLKVTVNEYSVKVGVVTKYVICASAYDNTAAFFGIFPYNLRLKYKELIVKRHFITEAHSGTKHVRTHSKSIEEAVCG